MREESVQKLTTQLFITDPQVVTKGTLVPHLYYIYHGVHCSSAHFSVFMELGISIEDAYDAIW